MDLRAIAQAALDEAAKTAALDMSLAEHDARWHPQGYKEGDKCLFRENMAKGDKGDADVANATPKEGGISGIFTGSAADYSKPSLMKIGTGEGSQVFGWGLYGSTERGVAEGYARTAASFQGLMNGEVVRPSLGGWEGAAMSAFINEDGNRVKSIKHIETLLKEDDHTDKRWTEKYKQALAWLKNKDNNISLLKENIYEQTFFTNRAPGDESHLMKWWGKMNEEQKQWIIKQSADEGLDVKLDSAFDGEDVYTRVTQACKDKIWRDSNGKIWGEELDNVGAKNASEFLYRAGIDGIKYPVDSYGHKGIKDGNKVGWNYVSFSDDHIRVDRKWRDGEEVDDAATDPVTRYLAQVSSDAAPRNPDFESKHPRGKGKFVQKFENFAKADVIPDSGNNAIRGQTRSPAFKRWFGDWENDPANASKIVDSRGRPLVVWHGSPNTDFTTFDKRKIHPKDGIRGFYFAPPKRRDSLAGYYGEGKERPFYLNIRNPLVCGPDCEPSKKELAEHDGIIRIYDDDEPWEKTFFNYRKDKMDTEIQRKGDIVEIVAFEPNQIKSADSNSGAFSPESKSTLDSAPFSPAAFLNYLAGEKKN